MPTLPLSLPRPARRLLTPTPQPQDVPPQVPGGDEADRRLLQGIVLWLVWLGIVVVGAMHHELWRDETRALSMALHGDTFVSVFGTLRNEGHPALWYLLLRAGYAMSGSPLVLPVLSIAVAAAAVWLLVRHSPFPLWQRALFVLGVFPAYEYSVMSRNYGLSMLLLFAWAVLGARRASRPVLAGAILFLLANTNVHSVVLVGALLVAWAIQTWGPFARRVESRMRTAAGMLIAVAGCIVCWLQTRPDATSLSTRIVSDSPAALLGDTMRAMVNPGRFFEAAFTGSLMRALLPGTSVTIGAAVVTLALLLIAVLLVRRPALLAAHLLAVAGLTALFAVVYPGFPRHQGLLVMFVITLFWMRYEPAPERSVPHAERLGWTDAASKWVLGVLLALQVANAVPPYMRDIEHSMTSAPAFAQWLREQPRFRNAIIVAEPDYVAESLPYYAPNRLYSYREQRFTTFTRWTRDNARPRTLADLIATGQRLKAEHGVPVLIAYGHSSGIGAPSSELVYGYGYRFGWTPQEQARFVSGTQLLTVFGEARGDENYYVAEVK